MIGTNRRGATLFYLSLLTNTISKCCSRFLINLYTSASWGVNARQGGHWKTPPLLLFTSQLSPSIPHPVGGEVKPSHSIFQVLIPDVFLGGVLVLPEVQTAGLEDDVLQHLVDGPRPPGERVAARVFDEAFLRRHADGAAVAVQQYQRRDAGFDSVSSRETCL